MIYYRNDVRRSGVNGRALVGTAKRLLKAVGETDSSLSISIVNDEEIRRINRDFRGKDAATDVLSFALDENGSSSPERLLGDVVISLETARRQAAQYEAPIQRELYRLLIHGLLHVIGHDHERLPQRRVMNAEERRLAAAIGLPWPYGEGSS
jgi:probable rRNA maturation factor